VYPWILTRRSDYDCGKPAIIHLFHAQKNGLHQGPEAEPEVFCLCGIKNSNTNDPKLGSTFRGLYIG
ncbi:hypothetical protein AB4Z22_39220, partial [Paenibacillus sp. TAF58]